MNETDESGPQSPGPNDPPLVGTISDEGFLLDTNPTWQSVLGWTPAELASIEFTDFVHPDDLDATATVASEAVVGVETEGFAIRLIDRDGAHHWFEWTVVSSIDGLHLAGHELVAVVDTNRALSESNERNRSRDEASQIGIITADESGLMTGYNVAAEKMFGYPAGEVIGSSVNILMSEPHHDAHDSYIERYLASREPRILDRGRQVEARRKDGTTFPLSIAVGEIRADGRSTFIAATEDLTDKLSAQAERQAALIAKQAALIANHAALAAENTNRATMSFLSRMSHELRSPLTAIMGFAQLSELEAETDEQRENAHIISSAGRQLLTLINDVLDFCLIEAGQLEMSLEDVSVSGVVSECFEAVMAQAHRTQMTMAETSDPGLFARADRQRLRQVLLNLCSNLVEPEADDGELIAEVTATTGGAVRVAVTNPARNIDPEVTGRLFESFNPDISEPANAEGVGLGLSLAAALTKAMGGTIGVQPAPGGGSTFWIELLASESPSQLPPRSPAISPPDEASHSLLYIEDNAPNLRLLERILEHRPAIALITADHGLTGLELAVSRHPDLILLDLHLPDLPGRDVLARLKSDPRTSDIPVVIVTADANPDIVDSFGEAGVQDFLTKPIDVQRVLSVVDDLIAGGGSD